MTNSRTTNVNRGRVNRQTAYSTNRSNTVNQNRLSDRQVSGAQHSNSAVNNQKGKNEEKVMHVKASAQEFNSAIGGGTYVDVDTNEYISVKHFENNTL